jgi:cytochrome P450
MSDSVATAAIDRTWRVGEAPGRLPLIGHLKPMLRDTLGFVDTLREHGDLVGLRLGWIRAYVVCHPELVREMLRDARTYDKGGKFYDAARAFLGNGIVVSNFAEHRVQRRLVQPAFHRQRLERYAAVMSEEAALLSAAWRPGDVIDIADAAHTAAARITFRSLFSTDAGGGIVQEVKEAIILMGDGVVRRLKDPTGLYRRLPLPANRRFDQTITRL